MKKVILFSFHHYLSKRKAGFHWIAKSLAEMGWEVLFVTAPLSPLSRYTGEPRWKYCSEKHLNTIEKVSENISISVYAPWYSPISLTGNPAIDLLSRSFIRLYRSVFPQYLSSWIDDSDLVIFESTAAILLFDQVRKRNGSARYVYRVSDALESLSPQPSLLDYEMRIAGEFDLISVPSANLAAKFRNFHPSLHYHGVEKSLFDSGVSRPLIYDTYEKNLVFIGNAYLDDSFIRLAAERYPSFGFHIIGPLSGIPSAENIIAYGELPFSETIPYIRHADIGLHTLRYSNSLASYSDSLKVIQYTWCRLPIIAPDTIPSGRLHTSFYRYDDSESIDRAIQESLRLDRSTIDRNGIYDWNELTSHILAEVTL